MSAVGVTLRGRRAAERLMVDECRIRRVTGTTTDPDTGEVSPTYETVYEGKGKLQSQQPYPSNPDAGEYQWTVTPLVLHLPVEDTGQVAADQLVEIVTSLDPANVGRTLRIRSGDRKSLQTAVRFHVEEVS